MAVTEKSLRGFVAICAASVMALVIYSSMLNEVYTHNNTVSPRVGMNTSLISGSLDVFRQPLSSVTSSMPLLNKTVRGLQLTTRKSNWTVRGTVVNTTVSTLVSTTSGKLATATNSTHSMLEAPDERPGDRVRWPRPPLKVPSSDVKLVLILSYQRTGSSFLGDVLFNMNPDVFFLYEPLDPLYAAMFGVSQGWTVPSDITTQASGSLRIPPQVELQAVTWLLEQMLSCNMTSLPLEVYLHRVWALFARHMTTVGPFLSCMRAQKLVEKPLHKCQLLIRTMCGNRFAQKGVRQDVCLKRLWTHEPVSADPKKKSASSFEAYEKCIHKLEFQVQRCVPRLETPCQARRVRAVKTVRATMRSVEQLLENNPNFYVIHSYRDPRSTVLSRKKADWARSIYDKSPKDVRKIAKVYCQTVLEDYRVRKKLEHKYPERIMELTYRDFIHNPTQKLEEVYDFLDLRINDKFRKTFQEKTGGNHSATISTKWKDQLKAAEVLAIQSECETFSRETGFVWDA